MKSDMAGKNGAECSSGACGDGERVCARFMGGKLLLVVSGE